VSLFAPMVSCVLTADEHRRFFAATVKDGSGGGPQGLYWSLVDRFTCDDVHEHVLTLDDEELLKITRYAYAYGNGGYQMAFRCILAAARRAGWQEPSTGARATRTQPKHTGRRWAGPTS
jgi:hypothetical protein